MSESGELLRAAREKKGVSLSDAEEATRIRARYLEALESGDAAGLPAKVYIEGFLRNYAVYLGLSASDVMAAYRRGEEQEPNQVGVQEAVHPVRLPSRTARIRILLLANLIALVALAVVLYRQGQYPPQAIAPTATPMLEPIAAPTPTPASLPETPSPAAPTVVPTPALPSTPVPGVQVQVRITDLTWMRITQDGEIIFEGTLEAGETRTWVGKERVTMLCGNAAGTTVTVNGKLQPALGAPGQVVELTWAKP